MKVGDVIFVGYYKQQRVTKCSAWEECGDVFMLSFIPDRPGCSVRLVQEGRRQDDKTDALQWTGKQVGWTAA